MCMDYLVRYVQPAIQEMSMFKSSHLHGKPIRTVCNDSKMRIVVVRCQSKAFDVGGPRGCVK